jgi:hypothetical protein
MNLQEMIVNSRKKNEKFDNIELSEFSEKQFYGALNLKASKEGTGYAGSFANKLFEMCRVAGIDLLEARIFGDLMQQEALDSKHDGEGSMYDTVWFKLSQIINFRGSEAELRAEINNIINGITTKPKEAFNVDLSEEMNRI